MKKNLIFCLLISLVLSLFNFNPASATSSQGEMRVNTIEDNYAQISSDQSSTLSQIDSGVKRLPDSFWTVGFKLQGRFSSGQIPEMSIKVSSDQKTWNDWRPITIEQDDLKLSEISIDPQPLPIFAQYLQYKITLSVGDNIDQVKIIAIDPSNSQAKISSSTSENSLNSSTEKIDELSIIKREEWGADESIMFWLTDMEHAGIKQIVVHHTATANDSPLDSAAIMRSMYYYHTVENGWGDIGYNYVIDQQGNIFEGRRGGLGVVAAHAFGFNTNSVGISLIGNYMEKQPSSASLRSLEKLIAYISFQTDLDLSSTYRKNGTNYATVVGHRDVNATACPGDILYSLLPDVINSAKAIDLSVYQKNYSAYLSPDTPLTMDLSNENDQTIIISYKNTGNMAWLKDQLRVTLIPTQPDYKQSLFADDSWFDQSTVAEADNFTIMPGEVGVFTFKLKPANISQPINQSFALLDPDGIIKNSQFTVQINNSEPSSIGNPKPTNPFGLSPKYYQAKYQTGPDKITLTAGSKKEVSLTFTNTGQNNWYNFTTNPVRLGTNDPADHDSIFSSSDWLTPNRINALNVKTAPGENLTFDFTLDATNVAPGTYFESFTPLMENLTWMDQGEHKIEIEVLPANYQVDVVKQETSIINLKAGEKYSSILELKNNGNIAWNLTGNNPLHLGTINDQNSIFSNQNWLSPDRQVESNRDMIYPGQTARFNLSFTAPSIKGTYTESYIPLLENQTWLKCPTINYEFNVN
ncbi:MAG: N-acetylmuramoyl-L-alanine amidase [Patescibacteria group bacterium]